MLLVFFSALSFAKSENSQGKDNETDIVCFAAQNQWVCAPEGQQDIAKQKAEKLVDSKPKDNVVITTIEQPTFQAKQQRRPRRPSPMDFFRVKPKQNASTTGDGQKNQVRPESSRSPQRPPRSTPAKQNNLHLSSSNPETYASMWSYQLIGVSTPQNAINYVQKMKLDKNEVLIVKTQRNGSEWWIVLYMLFKDKETGVNSKSQLPEQINKPWLRPLKNLNILGFIESF